MRASVAIIRDPKIVDFRHSRFLHVSKSKKPTIACRKLPFLGPAQMPGWLLPNQRQKLKEPTLYIPSRKTVMQARVSSS